ncbi:MAG TPA: hypothetical protein VMA75_02105 [Candidatus Paceibacterota bacterium]|nr:hypothetical protein [Candidatus Paceibacterota bacterium]
MIKKIVKYRTVSLLFLASFAFAASGFFWAWVALAPSSGPLILHFNDMGGITATGTFATFLLMGILGIAIVIMNFVIALGLEERDRILGKIVAVLTLVMAILLFLAFAAIIKVN